MTEPEYLKAEELATRWRCSPAWVRKAVADGELPAIRIGRMIRIPRKLIEEIEACNSPGTEGSSPSTSQANHPDGSQQGSPPQKNIVRLPNGRHATSMSP